MDQSALTLLPRTLIRVYQRISRGTRARCRFYPSCSEYAWEALAAKGLWRGLAAAGLRLLKCQPWHRGGYDPVHPSREDGATLSAK